MVYNLTCSRTPPAAVQIKTQARTFTFWSRARPGHHIGDHLQVLRWRFHSCFASAFFALSAAVYYWMNQNLANASCVCAIAPTCRAQSYQWHGSACKLDVGGFSHALRRRLLRRVLPCTVAQTCLGTSFVRLCGCAVAFQLAVLYLARAEHIRQNESKLSPRSMPGPLPPPSSDGPWAINLEGGDPALDNMFVTTFWCPVHSKFGGPRSSFAV